MRWPSWPFRGREPESPPESPSASSPELSPESASGQAPDGRIDPLLAGSGTPAVTRAAWRDVPPLAPTFGPIELTSSDDFVAEVDRSITLPPILQPLAHPAGLSAPVGLLLARVVVGPATPGAPLPLPRGGAVPGGRATRSAVRAEPDGVPGGRAAGTAAGGELGDSRATYGDAASTGASNGAPSLRRLDPVAPERLTPARALARVTSLDEPPLPSGEGPANMAPLPAEQGAEPASAAASAAESSPATRAAAQPALQPAIRRVAPPMLQREQAAAWTESGAPPDGHGLRPDAVAATTTRTIRRTGLGAPIAGPFPDTAPLLAAADLRAARPPGVRRDPAAAPSPTSVRPPLPVPTRAAAAVRPTAAGGSPQPVSPLRSVQRLAQGDVAAVTVPAGAAVEGPARAARPGAAVDATARAVDVGPCEERRAFGAPASDRLPNEAGSPAPHALDAGPEFAPSGGAPEIVGVAWPGGPTHVAPQRGVLPANVPTTALGLAMPVRAAAAAIPRPAPAALWQFPAVSPIQRSAATSPTGASAPWPARALPLASRPAEPGPGPAASVVDASVAGAGPALFVQRNVVFDEVTTEVGTNAAGPAPGAPATVDAAAGAAAGAASSGSGLGNLDEGQLDLLARRLYGPIRDRIARELLLDRERSGALADV